MHRTHFRRLWPVSVVAGASIGLFGCYTVLNHPQIAPQQQVTESGRVIGQNECAGCHTEADLWAFHHGAAWLAPSHEYYYYRYDPYFLSRRWYGNRYYYGRWIAYYHNPWWYYSGYSGGAWTPEAPAVGRGEPREDYDRTEPRPEFVPLPEYGPGPMPFTTSGLPLSTGSNGSNTATERAAKDSTSDYQGRPVRVEPRSTQSSPPPAQEPASNSSGQQKQASDDEDTNNQSRGRGDSREGGSSSRSR